MVRKTIWVAVAACASALLLSAPAGAQAPPTTYGPGPGAVIDDTEVQAGDVINVSGDCGEANEEVTVSLGGEVLATGSTDAEGMYSLPVELPHDLAPGTYTLEVECAGQVFTVTVEVAGAGGGTGPGGSGGSLSRTGTDLKAPIALGVGLVALGGVVLALASSRRRQST